MAEYKLLELQVAFIELLLFSRSIKTHDPRSASMKQFRSNYTASARLSAHRGPVGNYK